MEKGRSKYCNCLCHASNVLARNMTRMMDEELSVINLTSSYAYLLLEVEAQPGINPKSICEALELKPSTVTRLIEKMEHRGLLYREQAGRSTEVSLTMKGQELMKDVKDCIQNYNERYTVLLGDKKIEKLTESIYNAAMKIG